MRKCASRGGVNRHNRGFVLIVALAVLAVLALLGISFVTLQSMSQEAAKSYLDDKRALNMAESGVQFAISTLRSIAGQPDGLFATSGSESLWFYRDTVTVPVDASQKPSFAQGTSIKIEGKTVDYSGSTTQGDYGQHGNQYSLKVVDTSSQIYVNDSKNIFLKRILNNLGTELGAGADLGDKIIAGRPAGGYATKQALIAVLGKGTYDQVKDYLAVHSWVDTKVINPVPLSAEEEEANYPVRANRPAAVAHSHSDTEGLTERKKHVYRLGHGVDINGSVNTKPLRFSTSGTAAERAVYGWDELNPQWIETTSRAPININTAPKPVLAALLKGLSGFMVTGTSGTSATRGYASSTNESYPVYTLTGGPQLTFNVDTASGHAGQLGMLTLVGLTDAEASAIADKIIANRIVPSGTGLKPWEGPFKSWEQFNAFCDSLVGTTITAASQEQAEAKTDLLKANFNPNAHLNEVNPDHPLGQRVDKTDLVAMSTEFCFLPTGYFEIESVGRVLRPWGTDSALTATNNTEVARKTVYAVAHLYDLVRHTNQRDFYGDPAVATSLPVLSAGSGSYATNTGKGLQIGPAPDVGNEPVQTEYDGYVTLAGIGGTPGAAAKAAGAVAANPICTAGHGKAGTTEVLHGHFQYDLRLNYHKGAGSDDTYRQTLTRRYEYNTTPPPSNISAGKSVAASSAYYPATNGIDGNSATYWQVSTGNAAWYQIDLGAVYSITRVYVQSRWGFPNGSYTCYTSPDNATFTQQGATISTVSNTLFDWNFATAVDNVRYIRISIANPQADWYPTVTQMDVYAQPSASATAKFFFNRPTATASLTEPLSPPYALYDMYDPALPAAKKVHEYRLGRSYTGPAASGYFYAPSNHRIDGVYSERHSSFLYDSVTLNMGKIPFYGTVSYWIKPSFYPEQTVQPRTFFSLSRMHDYNPDIWNPTPFAHYFLPSQQNASGFDTVSYYSTTAEGAMGFPTRSFGFGFGFKYDEGYGASSVDQLVGGAVSRTMNKRYTVAENGIALKDAALVSQERAANPMKANRWMHVIVAWDANGGFTGSGTTADKNLAWEIYVNGSVPGTTKILDPVTNFTKQVVARGGDFTPRPRGSVQNASLSYAPQRPTSTYLMYCGGNWGGSSTSSPPPPTYITVAIDPQIRDDANGIWAMGGWDPATPLTTSGERYSVPIRFGEPSILLNNTGALPYYKRNFPADATMDEFTMYSDKTNGVTDALNQWSVGRYYRENDASFVSGNVDIQILNTPAMPPSSNVSPNGDSAPPAPAPRILGLTWTAYNTTLWDYKFNLLRDAQIQFTVSPDGGTTWIGAGGQTSASPTGVAGVSAAGWSPIPGADVSGSTLKYSFRMSSGADSLNSILLETPVLDDVTLYVEATGPLFEEYIVM